MKTNEAPEKIYLNPLLMEDGESVVRRCTFERQRDSQIEYTRTDAFIEKACFYIKNMVLDITYLNVDGKESYKIDEFIEDFKNYMKGE